MRSPTIGHSLWTVIRSTPSEVVVNAFPLPETLGRTPAAILLAAAMLLVCWSVAPAEEIVVDDSDGAPAYTETGHWTTTTNTGAGWNGTLYRYTTAAREPSTATWRPTLPEEGAWEVFAVFRRGADRTSRAPYTIHHLDGSTVVEIDQTGSFAGDLEVASLGAYRFAAGTDGHVVLSNDGGSGVYIADAMMWLPDTPPEFADVRWWPLYPKSDDFVTVSAHVTDNGEVDSVRLYWSVEPESVSGQADALPSGNGEYRAALLPQPHGSTVTFHLEAEDTLGSTSLSEEYSYTVGEEGDWTVIINEVMASNSFTIAEPDFGGFDDWVELYNFGPDTADLGGLNFSDRLDNPTRWEFPPGTTIPPNEYLLVWCNGRDFVGQAIHTSFSLAAAGEDAVLYDAETDTIVDAISWTDLPTDVSLARIPNLTGDFVETAEPTPGKPNLLTERAEAPVFSHESGFYTESMSVEITVEEGAVIRYTTDGSWPSVDSEIYSIPLEISDTTGLRARAFEDGKEPSITTSASYFYEFVPDRQIPVINIVVDTDDLFDPATGIYANHQQRGREWEREVHVSIFSPDGDIHESIDAGLRIHGGFSRAAAKKSLRLYFRNDYGQNEWSLPWLENSPTPVIRDLVLRAGGNDGFLVTQLAQLREVTFIRDEIIRDWFRQQGHYAVDGFFAAVYLNGEYWGLYNPVERVTDSQMEYIFGGGGDYDVVKGGWTFERKYFTEANDGDMEAWEEFLAWHEDADLTTAEDFAELKNRIDYWNFLDWFALNIAIQNEDWPHNNWIATRHRTDPNAKWVFHEWDAEWALGLRPQGWTSDSLHWARGDNFHLSPSHNGTLAPLSALFSGNELDPNRTKVITGILDNPQGVQDFVVAMENVLNFELVPEKTIAEFDAYAELIETEVPREAARWAHASLRDEATLIGFWHDAGDNKREFLENRPAFMHNLMSDSFDLGGWRTITFEAAGQGEGRLSVRGRTVDLPWTGTFFNGSDVELSAQPADGSRFESWTGLFEDEAPETVYTATTGPDATVTLTFESIGTDSDLWLVN